MAKRAAKGVTPAADKDALALKSIFLDERSDDVIMMFVPSHDQKQKALLNQDQWANAALKLFGELYRGATVFTGLKGIWRCDDGTEIVDAPLLIQSLVRREDAVDEARLERLAGFARRMCDEMNQDCVLIVCNDTMHYVRSH